MDALQKKKITGPPPDKLKITISAVISRNDLPHTHVRRRVRGKAGSESPDNQVITSSDQSNLQIPSSESELLPINSIHVMASSKDWAY